MDQESASFVSFWKLAKHSNRSIVNTETHQVHLCRRGEEKKEERRVDSSVSHESFCPPTVMFSSLFVTFGGVTILDAACCSSLKSHQERCCSFQWHLIKTQKRDQSVYSGELLVSNRCSCFILMEKQDLIQSLNENTLTWWKVCYQRLKPQLQRRQKPLQVSDKRRILNHVWPFLQRKRKLWNEMYEVVKWFNLFSSVQIESKQEMISTLVDVKHSAEEGSAFLRSTSSIAD